MTQVSLPTEVKSAIRATNLAYLFHYEEATPFILRNAKDATTNGAMLKGEFLSCLTGSIVLPEGTEGWLFEERKYHYDRYIWVGDENRPAPGAKRFTTGAYYTFVTLVDLASGDRVVASTLCETEYEAKPVAQ